MTEYKNLIDLNKLKSQLPSIFTDISILSYGKRGIVLKAQYGDLLVAIKMKRPESSVNSLFLEAKNLQKVNKLGIGPKFIMASDDYVVMEFINGALIKDWITNSSYDEILGMLSVLFHQLFELDRVQINKFELTNPHKHIIVKNDLIPVLIDFERARNTIHPKNITQFAQYLMSRNILPVLQSKNILCDVDNFKKSIFSYSKSKKHFDVIKTLL